MEVSSLLIIILCLVIILIVAVFTLVLKRNINSNSTQQIQAVISVAEQVFESKLNKSNADMIYRQNKFGELVSPIEVNLRDLKNKIEQIEKDRIDSFASLHHNISSLQKETNTLSSALRKPEVRGKWGELQLQRVLDMAGMLEHYDYDLQHSVINLDDKTLRPDVIVKMPSNKTMVIDSKVPLAAYLDSVETDDINIIEESLYRHADAVKKRIVELSSKKYWAQFANSPEFVVLFLPSENLFSSALDYSPELIEFAWANKVLIATPTTLIALLKSVSYGWQQQSLENNYKTIAKLGHELYERLSTMTNHFSTLGNNLKKSTESYNDVVGSLETRVLSTARKLKEHGVSTATELKSPEKVEIQPRNLEFKDF